MAKKRSSSLTNYIGKVAKRAQANHDRALTLNGDATKLTSNLVSHIIGEILASAREVSQYHHADEGSINGVKFTGRVGGTLSLKQILAATRVAVPGELREEVVDAGMAAVEMYKAETPPVEVA